MKTSAPIPGSSGLGGKVLKSDSTDQDLASAFTRYIPISNWDKSGGDKRLNAVGNWFSCLAFLGWFWVRAGYFEDPPARRIRISPVVFRGRIRIGIFVIW
jgi:hypothetical protein